MANFTLFLHNMSNYLLTKDIGVIPFVMKKFMGYDSEILCFNLEGTLQDNKRYLENLEVTVITGEEQLIWKVKRIDVLMLAGIYDYNVSMINMYKMINPSGKIYLKLDASIFWMSNVNKTMSPELLDALRKCDVITVESRRLQSLLNTIWGLNIEFLPNGYYNFINDDIIGYEEKKNTVMFVGRIGSPEKNNKLLLEAFKNVENQVKDWNISLIGEVTDDFLLYLYDYFEKYPHLRTRITLKGKIDKEELKEAYREAKVFCLTSNTEACANVLSEAVSNGCYLISSDVDGAIDIIDYGRHGRLFPINNQGKLEEALVDTCCNEELLKRNCLHSQRYAKEYLSWIKMCESLNTLLRMK